MVLVAAGRMAKHILPEFPYSRACAPSAAAYFHVLCAKLLSINQHRVILLASSFADGGWCRAASSSKEGNPQK